VADPAFAQLRGTAMYALVALGRLRLADVPARVPAGDVFDPHLAAMEVYAPLYREFARTYGRLKGMYRRLNG
jgi:sugar (pentulose or hexulose) kinase